MPDERAIVLERAGAREPDGVEYPQLVQVGVALIADVEHIVGEWRERLLHDPEIELADGITSAELEDHAATFVTDIGLALRVFSVGGADAAELMRDGTAILTLIAERHGAQRSRLGWSEGAVVRSLARLGELLDAAVQRAAADTSEETRDRARAVVAQLMEQAQRVSVGGYRMAIGRARG